MKNLFRSLKSAKPAQRPPGRRLSIDISRIAAYAVGDVHGCYDQLMTLERIITADARRLPGPKLIVMLGDYVDRGPDSAQIVEHLLGSPPQGFHRICLMGNHEMAMLDYLDGHLSLEQWLQMGAAPTLLSYGVDVDHMRQVYRSSQELDDVIRSAIPGKHKEFLRSLPIIIDAAPFLFVHAGIRPGIPLDEQKDEDLVFIRSEFLSNAHLLKQWVVHGHTPVEKAGPEGRRINIDTGAYYSGRLSALRLWNRKGRIFST
ncbi:serine/threonine protein phosphatase [Paramesorhizobium deserti]|uniref:Serine/threonine protein phosphatase n=1 Tax=Paramesorhizobium deserti TaxID=1494590 RepID=A0A135HTY2_9HYPH|nr:metallophosphoesterase family protein [Paramesorhizobium deserti]KXF76628.1 serine/threonine protein phosphatase [Paramesorhizobium deserti]